MSAVRLGLFVRWQVRRRATTTARRQARIAKARAAAAEQLMAEQRAARSGFEAAHLRLEGHRRLEGRRR